MTLLSYNMDYNKPMRSPSMRWNGENPYMMPSSSPPPYQDSGFPSAQSQVTISVHLASIIILPVFPLSDVDEQIETKVSWRKITLEFYKLKH